MANSAPPDEAKLIDVHIHAVPRQYADAIASSGGDPAGFMVPKWSLESFMAVMNSLSADRGVLSITAPGVMILGRGQEARTLARNVNIELAEYADDPRYKGHVDFFGVLPDWTDVQGTLAELDFLFREQKKALGVAVYTTYDKKLLGDAMFKPIWERLNEYNVLVFIHPNVLEVEPRFLASCLPQPFIEYPLSTTRTAVDLIMSGTFKAAPNVDIVLSHGGGTVPFLVERVKALYGNMPPLQGIPVTIEDIATGFKRFYYDIALSGSKAQLDGLLATVEPSQILFGTDHPYSPDGAIHDMYKSYREFVKTSPNGHLIPPAVLRANAESLLAKHAPS